MKEAEDRSQAAATAAAYMLILMKHAEQTNSDAPRLMLQAAAHLVVTEAKSREQAGSLALADKASALVAEVFSAACGLGARRVILDTVERPELEPRFRAAVEASAGVGRLPE